MYNINEIYRTNYLYGNWSYAGTLRNQKRFNIDDTVFFVYGENNIAKSRIIGVELPLENNADYIYKIQLPENLILENTKNRDDFYNNKNADILKANTLKCDRIFNTIEEAKESAIKQTNWMHELQLKEIESYFSQFK